MAQYADRGRKICTSFIYPPIPNRSFDWCAWYDDQGEEAGNYGHGCTGKEAIEDLLANHSDCPVCGEFHEPGAVPFACETGDGV